MAKWIQSGSTGISIGGEFFPADEAGIVDVPDNIGSLTEYGFKAVVNRNDAVAAAKEHAAILQKQASEAAAVAANLEAEAADAEAKRIADVASVEADKAKSEAADAEAEKTGKKGGK